MKMFEDLKQNVDNAVPLFQLLQKCHLDRPDVSMAVIQVLEGFLVSKNSATESSSIGPQLRAAFVTEFLEKQVLANENTPIPSYLRNKICQFLVTAFVTEMSQGTWSSAVSDLIEMAKRSSQATELVLRWCLMLTEEIASQRPQPRTDAIHQRNTQVRDFLRQGDNAKLCQFWRQILGTQNTSSVCLALECFANYSSWIDVGLVVETETLKLIYTHLQSSQSQAQLSAADCLAEIVGKGMQVGDKIALAAYLNLDSVFKVVSERGVVDAFFGRICKVLNNLAFSLLFSLQHQPAARDQVVEYFAGGFSEQLLAFTSVLAQTCQKNLTAAHEFSLWLEALASLLPSLSAFFELLRSLKDNLRPEFVSFLNHYLLIVLQLLERSPQELLDASEDDGSVDEDDEFMSSIRPTLLLHFDSIVALQGHSTISHLNSMAKSVGVHLGRIELLLQSILRLPEASKTPLVFMAEPGNLTPAGELVSWSCSIGNVLDGAKKPLPMAVSLLMAEVLVRYSSTAFLDGAPENIDLCLNSLVNCLESAKYSPRSADLMLRFIKNLKGKLANYANALLSLLQGNMATGQVRAASLYETAGLAVAALDPASVSLSSVTASLLQSTLQRALILAPGEDIAVAAEALELLSVFARGFTTDSCLDPTPVRAWFRDCLGLLAGKDLLNHQAYQASAISLIQRLIPLCQADTITVIQDISMRILNPAGTPEASSLALLLPLYSASIFKLRDQFACPAVLGALWPLIVDGTLRALRGPINGTDDVVQLAALCKVFMALLQAIITSPAASACTLAVRQAPIEQVLDGVGKFILRGRMSIDAIGLARGLCGGVQKTLAVLSPEFVYGRMIPFLLGQLIPVLFDTLEASVKVHIQALPAAMHQLVHDALNLARAAQQVEPQPGLTAAVLPIDFISTDFKDAKLAMLSFYIQQ